MLLLRRVANFINSPEIGEFNSPKNHSIFPYNANRTTSLPSTWLSLPHQLFCTLSLGFPLCLKSKLWTPVLTTIGRPVVNFPSCSIAWPSENAIQHHNDPATETAVRLIEIKFVIKPGFLAECPNYPACTMEILFTRNGLKAFARRVDFVFASDNHRVVLVYCLMCIECQIKTLFINRSCIFKKLEKLCET